MRKWLFIIVVAFISIACNRIDNTLPTIDQMKVNGIDADTIALSTGSITVEYSVSDDETVVDARIRSIELTNLDSGFIYLAIESINAKQYSGQVSFTIPDSLINDSAYFSVSTDAFDDSGNEAIQKLSVIYFP